MLSKQSLSFIQYFLRAYPRRTALLVGLLVLSGLAEGIGIATLLPLLELAVASNDGPPSALSQSVASGLAAIGLAPHLGTLLSLIASGMLLKGVFRLLAMKQVGFTVARVATDLRLTLIRTLLRSRWGYFTSQPAGQFTNAIGGEAIRAAASYRSVCGMIATLIQIIIYTVLALWVSWQIAVFAIVGGGVVVLVLSHLVRMSRNAGDSQTMLMKSLTSRLTDALQGIKPIKAMGREQHLQPLLEHETKEINRAQERQVLASEAVSSAQEPILVVLLAVALYIALSVGAMSLSALLIMAFVFNRLAGRVSLLQMDYQAMANGESAFWSMRHSIEAAMEQEEPSGDNGRVPALITDIRLENVSFGYGDRQILSGLDLTIPAGQFVALVGPSGAGKTTIADLVVGLYSPDSGNVLVDGVPLGKLHLAAWRHLIGYVPQEMFLFHDTVLQNVTLGDPRIDGEAVRQALIAAGAWEFVSQLPQGLDTVMGERGSRLSGGQRQRIAIARALVRNPRLLVLDEVTTALDPRTEVAICKTLQGLRGRVTILAISHQAAMTGAADLVYHLNAGRAVLDVRPRPALASL